MTEQARRGVSPLKVLLIVLLVAVLAVGGWLLWATVGRTMLAERATADALRTLESTLSEPASAEAEAELPPPTEGEPTWLLEIPTIDLRVPIIAGTSSDDLERGVGWYLTTNLPGEVGNMGIAGHRATDGKPFERLGELQSGDEVVVETRIKRYTYEIRVAPWQLTVQPNDSWILEPVPGKDFEPHEAVLTLTTEQDLVPTGDRMVGFAVLTKEEKK